MNGERIVSLRGSIEPTIRLTSVKDKTDRVNGWRNYTGVWPSNCRSDVDHIASLARPITDKAANWIRDVLTATGLTTATRSFLLQFLMILVRLSFHTCRPS